MGDVHAQTPEQHTGLRVSPPGEVAAGLPAVLSSLRHMAEKPGLVKGLQLLRVMNQYGGFDCTSCAWPDPDDHRTVAEFCENGAKAIADESTRRRVDASFFRDWSVAELSRQSDYWLNQQGRLAQPMHLAPGATHYQPIAWGEAFAFIGKHLRGLDSPDQAAFYTSGRTSNEAAFLYQLLGRKLGTNNFPDCSNMCHESSGTGLMETIGIGKGTVTMEDFARAEVILIVGQNPGTNHPRMLTTLEEAVQAGARLISVNPLAETGLVKFKNPQDFMHPLAALRPGRAMACLHLPVRINGDVAFLKALGKALAARNAFDGDFIASQTEGFEAYRASLDEYTWDELLEESGLDRAQVEAVADLLAPARRIIWCWAMGLTQHANGVANIQEIVNLALAKGAIGKSGAGLCPVRGHSNVQGDRTMGIWDNPSQAFLDSLARRFQFEPPRRRGLDTVETIKAMHEGKVRVFLAMGGNFLSATPDTDYTAEALRRCELTVQVSTKLNRSHLVSGREALILPCLGRTELDRQGSGEQFVSVENSMGVVHSSQGRQTPASPYLLSECAIVVGMAMEALPAERLEWARLLENYDRIREHIEAVVPGFQDYNRRIRQKGGFYLPNGPREGKFLTPSGKGHFTVHPLPRLRLEEGEYLMMTIRSHDQFNTTIYGLDDRYRGIRSERRVILLNPEDMRAAGLQTGDRVDLHSHFRGQVRSVRDFLVVSYALPRRCAATYFPETNPLVPIDHVAEKSNTPASKSIVIRLSRI